MHYLDINLYKVLVKTVLLLKCILSYSRDCSVMHYEFHWKKYVIRVLL